MRFSGTVEIEAQRQRVWDFLMDPNQVGSCGPGVQSIEELDADHFNIRAKVGVGFITATFTIHAEFLEREERARAKIGIRGQAPGSAVDGHGEMLLRDDPSGGTIMDWSTEVNIHGTIASVGARLIEGTANKLIGQTFTCIKSKLEVEGAELRASAAAAGVAATAAATGAAMTEGPEPEREAAPAHAMSLPEHAVEPLIESARAGAAAEPTAVAAEVGEAPAMAPESAMASASARLQYLTEAFGPSATNVYLIGNPDTGDALAVDVAHPSLAWVATQLRYRGWRLRHIISTSGDWDHVGDNEAVRAWAVAQERLSGDPSRAGSQEGGPTIGVHPSDRAHLLDPARTFAPFDVPASQPELDLVDGTRLRLGAVEFEVLHTPGHSPGSIALFVRGANLLLGGDSILAGGWGRTDLPGGSAERMADTVRRLADLGDEVTVLPAHGPATTIGRERRWIGEVLAGRLLR
ncbi:MAG: MBL fold metallo-hydrolase [Chloroflexi bacterium]|nr:MBL fold metallo-hydrolase [Chloroflexota bacterium]